MEPNAVSNFVHTKTSFGRGYNYEIGSFGLKTKGDIVSGALRNKDMISAAQKYAPNSSIIDINKLNNIVNDPEFKYKIRENTTSLEKAFLGIPLIDISLLPSNSEGSDVLDSNSLKGLSETNGDDNTDESIPPVIKRSPIGRHYSEPLPQKSNRPSVIRRSNTR